MFRIQLLGGDVTVLTYSNSTSSPIIGIHSRPFNVNGTPKLVHEHLVRERSKALATRIDKAKSEIKEQEMATINIQASKYIVGRWINWLYGQPMTACQDGWTTDADEMLEIIVDVCGLAHTHGDYECVNACLDAIRGALIEKRCHLKDPLTLLLPIFELGRIVICDMLVHSLAYGPCVDSGELNRWLDKLDLIDDDEPDRWTQFHDELCKALATRCAAQASGNLDSLPDFMAAHAYHLCKPGEDLCCGRKEPREVAKRKRSLDVAAEEEEIQLPEID